MRTSSPLQNLAATFDSSVVSLFLLCFSSSLLCFFVSFSFSSYFYHGSTTIVVQAEKAFGVTFIKSYVPIILDMQKLNYDAWRELFETHCLSFSVSGHLDGTCVPTSATDTPWKEHDGLVKMWIYRTISSSLLDTVLKTRCTVQNYCQKLNTLSDNLANVDSKRALYRRGLLLCTWLMVYQTNIVRICESKLAKKRRNNQKMIESTQEQIIA